jgi:hypothetical protein
MFVFKYKWLKKEAFFSSAQVTPRLRSENGLVVSHFTLKVIILPSQARDKHWESTQKRDALAFLQTFEFPATADGQPDLLNDAVAPIAHCVDGDR